MNSICFRFEAYADEAIKSGIIGSITDATRDYLDYVGFDRSLPAIMEALEQRYGPTRFLSACPGERGACPAICRSSRTKI